MFEKMLVCLDGSRLAEQILPYAGEQARRFKSKVVLLQVLTTEITIPSPEWPAASGYMYPTDIPTERYSSAEMSLIERQQASSKGYLDQIGRSSFSGMETESVTIQGDPGDSIVKYSQDNDIDLIALSTHGRTGLERAVYGSTAEYVLKKSRTPILIIRSEIES